MRLEGRELLKRIAELLYAAPSEFVQQDVRLRRLGQIHCEPAYCERLVPYLPPPKKPEQRSQNWSRKIRFVSKFCTVLEEQYRISM
jgi:hypothetical protein